MTTYLSSVSFMLSLLKVIIFDIRQIIYNSQQNFFNNNCLDSGGMLTYFQNIFVKIIFSTLKISHHFEFKAFDISKFTFVEKNVNTDNTAIAQNYSLQQFYCYIYRFSFYIVWRSCSWSCSGNLVKIYFNARTWAPVFIATIIVNCTTL